MACNSLFSGVRYLIIEGPHENKICFLNFIFFYFG